jgi:hypothetical protein
MLQFMGRYFGQANLELQIHGSIVGLTGEPQRYEITVRPYPEQQYIEEGYNYISQ